MEKQNSKTNTDTITRRKTILSGIQPSGKLTIGHLSGALDNWVKLQDEYNCFYMIADLHAITVRQVPALLRSQTLETVAIYLACGIDPKKSTLFVQSHVAEHSQLAWVLNCFTGMGECSKMTQFKDKSKTHKENINVGLFSYPTLMAADILLYQADLVPVGEDQKQHLELSRNLAQRFNHYYSNTFKIPEPYIPKIGARIMSLQEPTKKMSKSDENERNIIFIDDTREQIINKVKRSVTDSGSEIKMAADKPGISNLMTLYNIATGKNFTEIESEFSGKGYGDFKLAVGEAVADYIQPIREKFIEYRNDKKMLNDILKEGASNAHFVASRTLSKVYKKIGLYSLDK
ncbi:MAG: tryptophan--tRNA ligase [Ignavibacteria bacterium]|jgi:tryptophanyl-tRNA synthetase|nr:tryptophan--tRNA ligase [Ignavibacteria bacterium]